MKGFNSGFYPKICSQTPGEEKNTNTGLSHICVHNFKIKSSIGPLEINVLPLQLGLPRCISKILQSYIKHQRLDLANGQLYRIAIKISSIGV